MYFGMLLKKLVGGVSAAMKSSSVSWGLVTFGIGM